METTKQKTIVYNSCGKQGCSVEKHTEMTGYDNISKPPQSRKVCTCGRTKNTEGFCDGSHAS